MFNNRYLYVIVIIVIIIIITIIMWESYGDEHGSGPLQRSQNLASTLFGVASFFLYKSS